MPAFHVVVSKGEPFEGGVAYGVRCGACGAEARVEFAADAIAGMERQVPFFLAALVERDPRRSGAQASTLAQRVALDEAGKRARRDLAQRGCTHVRP